MKLHFCKIGVLAMFLAAHCLGAQNWDAGDSSVDAPRCNFASRQVGQRFIVADFDNDQKPDSISLSSLGRRSGRNAFGVRVCSSGRAESLFTVDSSDPSITVTAVDVNQDHSPDIVVEQLYTHRRIQVWLNDGHGDFHKAHADAFTYSDTSAPCRISAPSKRHHNSPRRAQLRRGTKLSIQRAKLPNTSCYSPRRTIRSLTITVQRDLGGPNLSRAPPAILSL